MNDQQLRGQLLSELYEQRKEDHVRVGPDGANSAELSERIRIAEQLAQYGLITFKMLNRHLGGVARITAAGVDVIEGATPPPIAMTIDRRQTINISGSHSFQVGDGNVQTIQAGISALLNSIEASQGSKESKEEARSLLRRALEHPLVAAIAGGAVGLLGG